MKMKIDHKVKKTYQPGMLTAWDPSLSYNEKVYIFFCLLKNQGGTSTLMRFYANVKIIEISRIFHFDDERIIAT